MMIDIAIIGGGPAGLSAAINAAARNKRAVVFGNRPDSSNLYKAELVNNYLGFLNVTGKEMTEAFTNHARDTGVCVKEGRVFQIMDMGGCFSVNFENEFFEAKTVILATGIGKGKQIPGEEEYLGRGVSYCATCDGMLYRDKRVCVVSDIPEGIEDANFLSEIAGKVYYLPALYKLETDRLNRNVEVIGGEAKEVLGDGFVTGLKTKDAEIECDGVFFVKATTPLSSLIYGLEINDNAICVNRLMETNLKGVYSAGDCTGWPYQISKAAGEGLVAAQSAARFIDGL